MNMLHCTAVVFVVGTFTCFTTAFAAPTASKSSLISPRSWNAMIEDESPTDPGIVDWFTKKYASLLEQISKSIADKDPKKIEAVRDYIKKAKTTVGPITSFIKQYYANDKLANSIIDAVNTFLTSLEKVVDGADAANHQDFMQNLTYLMEMLDSNQ